jgi:hypothetical protein
VAVLSFGRSAGGKAIGSRGGRGRRMAINWQDVRYRGDAVDVEELEVAYRVKD